MYPEPQKCSVTVKLLAFWQKGIITCMHISDSNAILLAREFFLQMDQYQNNDWYQNIVGLWNHLKTWLKEMRCFCHCAVGKKRLELYKCNLGTQIYAQEKENRNKHGKCLLMSQMEQRVYSTAVVKITG